jgi:hypothetical protein
VVERLADVEVVLGEEAVVHAGDRDRGHVMEVAGPELVGEVDGVLGALDVEAAVALLVGGHVVDRGEVEEVLDAGERPAVLIGDAEIGLGEVAGDGLDPVGAIAGRRSQALELVLGALAHQHMDVAFALEQPLDEMPTYEAGGSRDEVAHPVCPPPILIRGAGIYLGFSAPGPERAWSSRARMGSARRRAA